MVHEVDAPMDELFLKIREFHETTVMRRLSQKRPHRFHGLEFRGVRWKVPQDDVVGYDEISRDMESRLIDDKEEHLLVSRIDGGNELP